MASTATAGSIFIGTAGFGKDREEKSPGRTMTGSQGCPRKSGTRLYPGSKSALPALLPSVDPYQVRTGSAVLKVPHILENRTQDTLFRMDQGHGAALSGG